LAGQHLNESYANDGLRFWVRHLADLAQKYATDSARAQKCQQLLQADLAFIGDQVSAQQRGLDFHPPEGQDAAAVVDFFDHRIAEANLGYALGLPEIYLDLVAASDPETARRQLAAILPDIERNEAILSLVDSELARRGRSDSLSEGGLVRRARGRYHQEKAHLLVLDKAPPAEVLGQLEKAHSYYQRGGDETLTLEVAADLGRSLFANGQAQKALTILDQAVTRSQALGFRAGEVKALIERAKIRKAQNQADPARSDAQRAVGLLEEELDQLGGGQAGADELREQARQAYSLLGELQIQAGQTEKALETLTKERQFQTVTALGAQVQSQDQTTQKALVAYRSQQQRTQALQLEAQTLKSLPAQQRSPDQLKKVEALLADSKASFLQTTRELRSANPRVFDATLSLKPIEFGRLQHSIPPEAAVVQYFPTDDTLYFFVVTAEAFRLRALKVGKADIDERVKEVRRGLADPQSGPPVALKTLYTQLIAPVEADIADKKVVAVVPTLRLHYLPFAALQAPDGHYLIEKHQLVVLSKASDLSNLGLAHPKTGRFAGFGNPDGTLPASGEEVKALQKLFPDGQAYVGQEATKEHLIASAPGAAYLHLATHGRLSPRDPNQSYLVMGNHGELTPSEIFELQLDQASLVTLSACETGLGEADPQSSITSLAEAFWAAGPPTVVASLWKVADDSTRSLMEKFYAGLLAKKSPALALQEAQKALLAEPATRHPFHWAAFTMIGDWR
ncbi:MAG: CHAT domain-containing protein, partial [Candidatus Eremiobacteraeota bacterium]|nr:CHAT domain-containing protein [Candidatus Eremiobacteraeota bacterium]